MPGTLCPSSAYQGSCREWGHRNVALRGHCCPCLQQTPAPIQGSTALFPRCFLPLCLQIASRDGPADSKEPRCLSQTPQSLLHSIPSSRNGAKSHILSSSGHHLSHIPLVRSV